ncbi:hypothetical protein GF359_00630 [candidate division WOR-3 bacterium]|uniref:Penicillin-binding protein transpeptidase domain-containing protein n=1 Tax=candidate division WOR-3 bacterium TaxID=2052148 RepID=A0A9D5K7G5_UNCW3|nr:hypothetical protein [candidate division WOR-3 bacterium]MBD3363698.1 hypothetical protein [candidate division WOR-3 bacterium]
MKQVTSLVLAGVIAAASLVSARTFEERCADIIGEDGAVAVMELASGRLIAATNPQILFTQRFPPGSLAKIMTATAAIDEGIGLPADFFCSGRQVINSDTLLCSVRDGHGKVDFDAALMESCNLYFQNLARNLSCEQLASVYHELNLCERVGVGLPGEVESTILTPSTDSAKLSFAIGQGSAVQLTPVAALSMISGFATGQLLRPRLEAGPAVVLSSFPSEKALHRIRPLLRQAVRKGTGKGAELSFVEVAGKTGTSTVLGDWVTHGWFAGFAPYENPDICIVVFLERGEGKDAAKIAGRIIAAYYGEEHACD